MGRRNDKNCLRRTPEVITPGAKSSPKQATSRIPPARACPDTPLRDLYYKWRRAKSAYAKCDLDDEAPEARKLYNQLTSIEMMASNFQPKTLEDMAFKVIFADDDGDMDANRQQKALVDTAYRLLRIRRTQPSVSFDGQTPGLPRRHIVDV